MLLHPLKDQVPSPMDARGRAILGLLDEVSHAEAPDLFCRTRVGVLLVARPWFEDSSKDQDCFNTLWQYVERWMKAYLPQFEAGGFRSHQGCPSGGPCGVGSRQRVFQTVPLTHCSA
jgi:hypothetical protein